MSPIAEPRVRARATPRRSDHDRRGLAAVRALADVAEAACAFDDVDAFLRLVAARACAATGVRRCGVYVRDGDRFAGRAAHPAGELEADVRQIVPGGPSDAFTREIVETRAPVLIRDARSDPRGRLTALRAWRVHAILGVPLLAGDDVVGLLFLDNRDQPHPYDRAHVEIAAAVGRVAGAALAQAGAMSRLRGLLDTAARQNRLLRSLATADNRFSQVLLEGGGLRATAAILAEMTGKPVALYDAELRRVASAPAADDMEVRLLEDADPVERIVDSLRETAAGASSSVGPLLDAGVRRRHLVAPVDAGGERWGWVVVMEHPARLGAFDEMAIRRAARFVALELAATERAATAAWDARALLARQLIRGTQDEDVRRGAEHLAIELERPRVVAFVTGAGHRGEAIDPQRLVAALAERVDGEVLATKGPEGVAVLLDVAEDAPPRIAVRRAKAQLAAACDAVGDGLELIAGVSAVCRGPRGVPRAYREAREVARCIDRLGDGGAQHVLAADDLGPGRLFVATGEARAIERFVDDAVGALLTGDEGATELLRTLHAYFESSRSVRLSAGRLGVHENTVRYRLARVQSVTGLDVVGDASDELSVQMSLLVLRLKGHPALPSFDADEAGAPA